MKTGKSIYKAEKLLRITLEFDSKIQSIRIEGDFFMHPEEKIQELEDLLRGIEPSEDPIREKIREFLGSGVQAFGFDEDSLTLAIMEAVDKAEQSKN